MKLLCKAKADQETRQALTAEEELEELQGQWELQSVKAKGDKENKKRKRDRGDEGGREKCEKTQVFVRGKKVEENDGTKRRFFRLVLAKKAIGPVDGAGGYRQVKSKGKGSGTGSLGSPSSSNVPNRHELPPLEGPKVLPEIFGKSKGGRGKGSKGSKGKNATRSYWVGHWMLLHHTPKILVKDAKSGPLWWHPAEQALWGRGGRATETCNIQYLSDGHREALERHENDPLGFWRTKKGFQVQLRRV